MHVHSVWTVATGVSPRDITRGRLPVNDPSLIEEAIIEDGWLALTWMDQTQRANEAVDWAPSDRFRTVLYAADANWMFLNAPRSPSTVIGLASAYPTANFSRLRELTKEFERLKLDQC
jgi:hypothetical protein